MIHLICLGNPLHADDGFGPAMAHRLGAMRWPAGIRLFDASADGGVQMFEHCRRAVVLDVLAPGFGPPGQVLRLKADDYPADPRGPFGSGTAALLSAVARLVRPAPEIEILGPVACLRLPFSPGLSPLVAAAVETVAAMLGRELEGRQPCARPRLVSAAQPQV